MNETVDDEPVPCRCAACGRVGLVWTRGPRCGGTKDDRHPWAPMTPVDENYAGPVVDLVIC